jgi:hypothetical protein
VFRKAGLTSVSVKLLDRLFSRMPPTGPQQQQMAAHDCFPVVRRGVHKVGIPVHDYCVDDVENPLDDYCVEDVENPFDDCCIEY